VEEHNRINIVPESELLKDSCTGYIHFRCPSCKADLAVDPLKVIGSSQNGSRDHTERSMTYPTIFVAIAMLGASEFAYWLLAASENRRSCFGFLQLPIRG
jgi:hypothetical protein